MDQWFAGASDALMFVALVGYVVAVPAFAAAQAFGRSPARHPSRVLVTTAGRP
ncbi:hypothetical protein [Nonomuraea sp. JJY05]|jgi:hypothetical protein|uniref:hypothetical protein n=1 Tax=Nonomuraea sp. JJY05 TaxID=3350255 RepID=UPI00373E8D47